MPFRSFCALVCAALAGAAAAATAAAVDPSSLDLEARIEYGYFTEDARTLETLANGAPQTDTQDGMKSYYTGLAGYRLALLQSSRDKAGARTAAEKCVSSLDRALQAPSAPSQTPSAPSQAEALALQSACLELESELGALRSPFAGTKSKSQMQKALRAGPRNPRVLLLDAVGAFGSAANGAEADRALAKLKKAIGALESERQEVVHAPAWGLADAYTRLGRIYLERGNTVAARDALERALLAAPEFQQARRLMTKIISG
jgi:tetratricopeptide (TPR) repeat protein